MCFCEFNLHLLKYMEATSSWTCDSYWLLYAWYAWKLHPCCVLIEVLKKLQFLKQNTNFQRLPFYLSPIIIFILTCLLLVISAEQQWKVVGKSLSSNARHTSVGKWSRNWVIIWKCNFMDMDFFTSKRC